MPLSGGEIYFKIITPSKASQFFWQKCWLLFSPLFFIMTTLHLQNENLIRWWEGRLQWYEDLQPIWNMSNAQNLEKVRCKGWQIPGRQITDFSILRPIFWIAVIQIIWMSDFKNWVHGRLNSVSYASGWPFDYRTIFYHPIMDLLSFQIPTVTFSFFICAQSPTVFEKSLNTF
jgi:hypothetical protein